MISNCRYLVTFSLSNVTSNSYLNFAGISSQLVPFVVAENALIVGYSLNSNTAQSGVAVNIYQNNYNLFTCTLNGQSGFLNNLSYSINSLDQISAYVSGLSNGASITVNLFLQINP